MPAMTHSVHQKTAKTAVAQPQASRWRSYVGSVLFFKHLILLTVLILTITPWFVVANLSMKNHTAKSEAAELAHTVAVLEQQLEEKTDALKAAEEALLMQQAALSAEEAALLEEQAAFTEALTGTPPTYQELYPDFYAPQPLALTERAENTIYLTFDDGPSPRTPEVLEILREKDVKATFFVVGQNDEQSLQWMRDIVAEGHTLGMHSYTHRYNDIYASVESYLEDMYQMFTQIKETTGVAPTVFRFPGGSINAYNTGINQEIITEMLRRGFVPYDWNVSSEDAATRAPSAETIVSTVTQQVQRISRGVVLMHDSDYKYTTVAALPTLIDRLKEQGFAFDAIQPDTQPVLFSYSS